MEVALVETAKKSGLGFRDADRVLIVAFIIALATQALRAAVPHDFAANEDRKVYN